MMPGFFFFFFLGRAAGSRRAAGAREDRTAAPSWLGLITHRHGFLQDERGRLLKPGQRECRTVSDRRCCSLNVTATGSDNKLAARFSDISIIFFPTLRHFRLLSSQPASTRPLMGVQEGRTNDLIHREYMQNACLSLEQTLSKHFFQQLF